MTAILIRIIIYAAIAGFIYFGVRKLWRELSAPFRNTPAPQRPNPTIKTPPRPEVIDLKRDADGVYRPPEDRLR